MNELMENLQRPFEGRDIEWRVGSCGQKKDGGFWAKALAYVTNRAIMSRLDDLLGVDGWKNEFREWNVGESHGVLCGLSLKIGGEWITKWDGAENTDFEPVKGGLSSSMKRTAVQWGIGRYLYNLDETWVECSASKGQGNWNYAKTPKVNGADGAAFYWKTPTLPAWALPQIDKKPAAPSNLISEEQANRIGDLLLKYEFDRGRFLTWASKAAKHDIKDIGWLPSNLYEKAKTLLEAEGNKVPA